MRAIGVLLLAAAGAILFWVGATAGERTYEAPQVQEPSVLKVDLSGEVPSGHVVQTFDVEGICCEGCGGKLYTALAGVEGVHEAAVDPFLKVARAVVPAGADPEALRMALTFDKYSATLQL